MEKTKMRKNVVDMLKRECATANLEDILTDAWNFLSLQEEEEERQAELYEDE